MKDALKQMPQILRHIQKRGYLLMLDFDGVLAPIVAQPHRARMSERTRALLAKCAQSSPVAVISGRALTDVRKRARLSQLWYAGNHGAEWWMGKLRGREELSSDSFTALHAARDEFRKLSRHYRGVIVQDKALTFSVHFRHLSAVRTPRFKTEVRRIAKDFFRTLDVAEGGEYIYNVRSRTGHTKAFAVKLARRLAPKGAAPIFIGDDTTDEDAFEALPNGITIRVGKHRGSAARYFVRTRKDVDIVLSVLANS